MKWCPTQWTFCWPRLHRVLHKGFTTELSLICSSYRNYYFGFIFGPLLVLASNCCATLFWHFSIFCNKFIIKTFDTKLYKHLKHLLQLPKWSNRAEKKNKRANNKFGQKPMQIFVAVAIEQFWQQFGNNKNNKIDNLNKFSLKASTDKYLKFSSP